MSKPPDKHGTHLFLILTSPHLRACSLILFFLRFYLFIFREREREGEREGEKHRCVRDTSIGCHSQQPNGDLAHNPGVCPDWELNRQPFGSQAHTQSTEPYQPGHLLILESGEGRKRDRQKYQCERERLIGCFLHKP